MNLLSFKKIANLAEEKKTVINIHLIQYTHQVLSAFSPGSPLESNSEGNRQEATRFVLHLRETNALPPSTREKQQQNKGMYISI